MSDEKPTEACGRCSMTAVVDAVNADEADTVDSRQDPFDASRIEVEALALRRVSPVAWARGITNRLNEFVVRHTYGQ